MHPRFKAWKPLKRPALRGVVIRAGATCDPRPLSCFKIEPLGCPSPWAFCRTETFQKIRWLVVKRTAGRLVLCRPPRVILCVAAPKFQGQNCAPAQSRTKAPTPRFTPSEVYGCHLARRMGTQVLTTADTGLCGFGLWCPLQVGGLWQRIARQKFAACSQFFELFKGARSTYRGRSMITAW